MTPVCPFFVCRVLRFLRGSRTPIIMRTKKRMQLLLGPRVRKQPQRESKLQYRMTPEVISSCVYYQMILQALQCDKHCGTTTLDRDIHVDSSYCIGTAATNITRAFTPITFTPNATYAEQLLHQTALTADTFYTKTDLTQTASHQTVPNSFYTRRIVLYTKSFLHQTAPDILRTPMYLLPGNVIVFQYHHRTSIIIIIILLPSSTVVLLNLVVAIISIGSAIRQPSSPKTSVEPCFSTGCNK